MAKAEKSKSALVREYLEQNPNAQTKEICQAFEGQDVSYQLIAKVASDWRKTHGVTKKRRGRAKKAVAAKRSPASTKGAKAVDLTSIDEGVRFVEQCGGVNQAREVLEVISRISSIESKGRK